MSTLDDTGDDGGLRVRPAGAADLDLLVAFNAAMAHETEGRQLDVALLERGVRSALTDAARGRYLVAERAGSAVGSLMLTTEWSDWRAAWFWWIQSVYVVPEARRSGVYRALYGEVLAQAERSSDVCGVRLYVETENEVAARTYAALGMQRARYHLFERDFVLGRGS